MIAPQDFLFLLLIRTPGILIGLTIHEYAHGYIAWRKGDNTAKANGRLTFNPLAHLDVFGTLMLLFGPFGWAKPVPVNPLNLDNPKRDMIFVGAAGPISNIILAIIIGFTLRLIMPQNVVPGNAPLWCVIVGFAVIINLGLAFFNLIPIPPLDGSNILMGLLPPEKIGSYLKYIKHAPKVLLGLIVLQWGFEIPIFSRIIDPFWNPFFNFWQYIIFGGNHWQIIIFGGKVI